MENAVATVNPAEQENGEEKKPLLYRAVRRTVKAVSPKYQLYGTENLPGEACVIVGNHSQIYGPIAAELYMPRAHYTWCIGQMMNRKEVPAYAFEDFWSEKPRWTHWFYRALSHMIAPLASFLLSNAHTIPVYRDTRVISTFRKSMEKLKDGADIVIFPESHEPYNGIVWKFHEHFADLAVTCHKRTGNAICFVPAYISPKLGRICFGAPVRYRPENPDAEERERICRELMDAITALAAGLPEHRVVPYANVPKKEYPINKAGS